MMAADMVEMRVAGDANKRPLANERHMFTQAHMPKPRIEQQIAVPSPDMPHVATEKWLDPRLVDKRYVIRHADGLVPLFVVRNGQQAQVVLTSSAK
jgi:hypothetical protein